MKRAALLLRGGMDSTTMLAYALRQDGEIFPVLFDYNQKHKVELDAAQKVVDYYASRGSAVSGPRILKVDLGQIGCSALTAYQKDSTWKVPDNMAQQIDTVVPFRNTLLITMAAAYAESLGIVDVFAGPVKEDFEAYRDCRPTFYHALMTALSLGATRAADLTVHTPFVTWWKKEVIKWGLDNNVPYNLTHTCYNGVSPACGTCPACRERLDAFKANDAADPIPYEAVAA